MKIPALHLQRGDVQVRTKMSLGLTAAGGLSRESGLPGEPWANSSPRPWGIETRRSSAQQNHFYVSVWS